MVRTDLQLMEKLSLIQIMKEWIMFSTLYGKTEMVCRRGNTTGRFIFRHWSMELVLDSRRRIISRKDTVAKLLSIREI